MSFGTINSNSSNFEQVFEQVTDQQRLNRRQKMCLRDAIEPIYKNNANPLLSILYNALKENIHPD